MTPESKGQDSRSSFGDFPPDGPCYSDDCKHEIERLRGDKVTLQACCEFNLAEIKQLRLHTDCLSCGLGKRHND